ncbi:MAG: GTPase ObgE [bacterium]|nr:GTPase ObgE [bacterium]
MFVDSAVVTFTAGKGGDGCVSFRREKFVANGGPNGGDGGNGGNIILISDKSTHSLVDFKFKRNIKSDKGINGSGSNKTGRNGKDHVIKVPAGTIVKTHPDEKTLFDFSEEGMEFVVVRGGNGGAGNARFKTSIHQSPRNAKKGEEGEVLTVMLELKLIAFAGLVGFPNAGKSTLISKISGAKPKIADYPFTTLTPHLGVVYRDFDSLVVADIPGIIEGAHKGEGMGINFLKHIERNRVLVFLLDVSPFADQQPLEALKILRDELKSYKTGMLRKKQLIAANKIDLLDDDEGSRDGLEELREYAKKEHIPFLELSGVKGINLEAFKSKLFELYHEE